MLQGLQRFTDRICVVSLIPNMAQYGFLGVEKIMFKKELFS